MKHCILVKYNADIDAAKIEKLLSEIKEVFSGLSAIEGIHGVEVIPNVVDRPNRYDLLIRIDMEKETLPVYDDSEPHHIWKRDYACYLEKKAIFDYE